MDSKKRFAAFLLRPNVTVIDPLLAHGVQSLRKTAFEFPNAHRLHTDSSRAYLSSCEETANREPRTANRERRTVNGER